MSFGWSVSDAVMLAQVAWRVVQNTRKACGEHAELTREVSTLHLVFKRLSQELAYPDSLVNRRGETWRQDLERVVGDCGEVLDTLDKILAKYMALSAEEGGIPKLWEEVRFGNGKVAELSDLRSKITFHTSAITFYLNLASTGSLGKVEKQMNEAGGDLRHIKTAINGITAHLMSQPVQEGSIFTSRSDDDRAVWREIRRELVDEGFRSSVIKHHKNTIKAYIKELGSRGALDDLPEQEVQESSSDYTGDQINTMALTSVQADTETPVMKTAPAESPKEPCCQTAHTSPGDSLLNSDKMFEHSMSLNMTGAPASVVGNVDENTMPVQKNDPDEILATLDLATRSSIVLNDYNREAGISVRRVAEALDASPEKDPAKSGVLLSKVQQPAARKMKIQKLQDHNSAGPRKRSQSALQVEKGFTSLSTNMHLTEQEGKSHPQPPESNSIIQSTLSTTDGGKSLPVSSKADAGSGSTVLNIGKNYTTSSEPRRELSESSTTKFTGINNPGNVHFAPRDSDTDYKTTHILTHHVGNCSEKEGSVESSMSKHPQSPMQGENGQYTVSRNQDNVGTERLQNLQGKVDAAASDVVRSHGLLKTMNLPQQAQQSPRAIIHEIWYMYLYPMGLGVPQFGWRDQYPKMLSSRIRRDILARIPINISGERKRAERLLIFDAEVMLDCLKIVYFRDPRKWSLIWEDCCSRDLGRRILVVSRPLKRDPLLYALDNGAITRLLKRDSVGDPMANDTKLISSTSEKCTICHARAPIPPSKTSRLSLKMFFW